MAKTVLLLGADTLLGKDLRERFEEAVFQLKLQPASLLADATAVLKLSEDEIVVVPAVDADMIADAAVVLIASQATEALRKLREAGCEAPIIDLTGELDGEPGARLRAPLFETKPPDAAIHIVPHPAAWLLMQFFNQLHVHLPIKRAVATIMEPASQSGTLGLQELQQQTVALLSFKKLPQTQFDAQIAFNTLARTGTDSPISLAAREQQIERALASLLALHNEGIAMPSLRMIHAPVFHGYGISVWVEFSKRPNIAALLQAMQAEGVDVRGPELDPPHNAGMAGQDGYAVGAVEADRNHPQAAWFWLAADNFRLTTSLTLELVREMI